LKKIITCLTLVFLFCLPLFVSAGTIACQSITNGTVTCRADGTSGSVKIPGLSGYWLCAMQTSIVTAPTAAYDITIKTESMVDILGGAGVDRSETTAQVAYPIVDTTSSQRACIPIRGTLTLATANQSEAAAVLNIELWLERK
jgi:hypothetical protein